jgi:uncharacterized protein YpmS
METQNVTLSIRKDLLKAAKHIAIERNTSLSGLLNSYLENIITEDSEYRRAMEHMVKEMQKGYNLGYEQGTYSRDDLHER